MGVAGQAPGVFDIGPLPMFCEERPEAGARHGGRSALSGARRPFICRLGPLRLPRHDRGPVPGEGPGSLLGRVQREGPDRALSCALRWQGGDRVLSHRFLCAAQGQRVYRKLSPRHPSSACLPVGASPQESTRALPDPLISGNGRQEQGGGRWSARSRNQEEPEKQQLACDTHTVPLPFPGRGLGRPELGHVFAQWALQTHPREDSTSWLDLSAAGGPTLSQWVYRCHVLVSEPVANVMCAGQ